MKSVKLFLLSTLIVTLFCTCEKQDEKPKPVCLLISKKIIETHTTFKYKYDSNNRLEQMNVLFDEDIVTTYTFEYASKGNMVRYNEFLGKDKDYLSCFWVFEYDQKNNKMIIKKHTFNADGSPRITEGYIGYNNFGQPNLLSAGYAVEYDSKHNATKILAKGAYDKYNLFIEYTYDDKPNIIGASKALQQFDFYGIYFITFSQNNPLTEKWHSYGGGYSYENYFEYEYNSNNYPSKCTFTSNVPGRPELTNKFTYEYEYECK